MSTDNIKEEFLGILQSDAEFTLDDLKPIFTKYDSSKSGTLSINEVELFFEETFGITAEDAATAAIVIVTFHDKERTRDFALDKYEFRSCLNESRGAFLRYLPKKPRTSPFGVRPE